MIETPSFCSNCGNRLRPGACFCASCGKAVQPKTSAAQGSLPEPEAVPLPAPAVEAALEIVETPSMPSAPLEPEILGYKLMLEAVPAQARGRVVLALRQVLGLSPQDAGLYAASAPVLLAVGLTPEMAGVLSNALNHAGAQVSIEEPPAPPTPPRSSEPIPEPKRRMAKVAETVNRMDFRAGLRTVTGLDIGQTFSYLAYARADGERLVMPPEMLRFEAKTGVPTALKPAHEGSAMAFGDAALVEWQKNPSDVTLGLLDQIGESDEILPLVRRYLEVLAARLNEVLMPGALSMADGASTTLGIPAEWDQGRIERLLQMAIEAGFPVNRVAPRPLAALTCHLQQGTLRQGSETEKTMVIDWGGHSLGISFVEHGTQLAKPQVFEHFQYDLGGCLWDEILLKRLSSQLPPELAEEDQRALLLFTRGFKEQMSRVFNEGKTVHTQYCVIPAGSAPIRVRLDKSEFEELTAEQREGLRQALSQSVNDIGLKPAHINHVIVAGGGAKWYFIREAVRSILEQVPIIGTNPEETFARGLAAYRLLF